jgi:hypothetical protein
MHHVRGIGHLVTHACRAIIINLLIEFVESAG